MLSAIDRIRVAPQRLDARDAELASAAVRALRPRRGAPIGCDASGAIERAGEANNVRPGCASFRASPLRPRRRRFVAGSATRRSASLRAFCARESIAWRAPSAATKSCAVWPMRRSGGERPSSARIGRLRKASVSAAGGQTVSSSPASSVRSKSAGALPAGRGWRGADVRAAAAGARCAASSGRQSAA